MKTIPTWTDCLRLRPNSALRSLNIWEPAAFSKSDQSIRRHHQGNSQKGNSYTATEEHFQRLKRNFVQLETTRDKNTRKFQISCGKLTASQTLMISSWVSSSFTFHTRWIV